MKVKRYKKVNKYLTYYRNNCGFRTPYQVLVDATFCQHALKNKINIQEQLPKYLGSETRLFTTVCVVNETEKIGGAVYGAMIILKQFNVRKCGHEKKPIDASECLHFMVQNNNSDHYFIATQDLHLTQRIRELGSCPLLYVKCNTINLEKPKNKTIACEESQATAETEDDYQFQVIKQLKDQELTEETVNERKRKKRKGVNPLSCKPKKKTPTSKELNDKSVAISKKSRKRNRTKVAKHVKQLLQSSGVTI